MKTGTNLIVQERRRQIEQEGWTPEHDDEHDKEQLAFAAAAYIAYGDHPMSPQEKNNFADIWPWDLKWWKPASRIRNLVKAGALIAAGIDRLLRKGEVA